MPCISGSVMTNSSRRWWLSVLVATAAMLVLVYAFTRDTKHWTVHAERIQAGGSERTFRIVVPDSDMRPATAFPLVIAFHGIGDTAESMAESTDWDRLAGEQRFVLVYPNARGGSWDITYPDEATSSPNADIAFVDALIEHVSADYPVDGNRVYLIGMSHGAAFVRLLSALRPQPFAAAVAHSGSEPNFMGDDASAYILPTLFVVGDADSVPTVEDVTLAAEQHAANGAQRN